MLRNKLNNYRINDQINITLDAKHNDKLKHFKELYKSLPEKKKLLKEKIDKLKELKIQNKNINFDSLIQRDNLKNDILELKKEIDSIKNRDEEIQYYLNVGLLLHSYYETIDNVKTPRNDGEIPKESNHDHEMNKESNKESNKGSNKEYNEKNNKKNLMYYFNNISSNSEENNNIEDIIDNQNNNIDNQNNMDNQNNIENENDSDDDELSELKSNYEPTQENDIIKEKNFTSTKIGDFYQTNLSSQKKTIIQEYLKKIDPEYVSIIDFDISIFKCPNCNHELTLYPTDGFQICEKCGTQKDIIIESDKPSFKDPPPEASYFSYRRINHYNEWLAQLQAKESTEIPDEVYDKILLEIKKERITNLAVLNTKKIRAYLKKLKLNKYYDHASHILYRINNIPPPVLSKELEEKLRVMFKEIQGPFMEVCPKNRKNFLNYSYILHKFVELLGLDDYKQYFPLLKDREKLHQTDMIWKKICEKIGWHFIKSI
jgi:hypothetical protein